MQLAAVMKNWKNIEWIKNPSEAVQLFVVKIHPKAILHYIWGHVCNDAKILALKEEPELIERFIEKFDISILNACKNEILTYILINFKRNNFINIKCIILPKLFDVGINWHELHVIKQSIIAFETGT